MIIMIHANNEYGEPESIMFETKRMLKADEIRELEIISESVEDITEEWNETGEEDKTLWDVAQWIIDEAAKAGIELDYKTVDLELDIRTNF